MRNFALLVFGFLVASTLSARICIDYPPKWAHKCSEAVVLAEVETVDARDCLATIVVQRSYASRRFLE